MTSSDRREGGIKSSSGSNQSISNPCLFFFYFFHASDFAKTETVCVRVLASSAHHVPYQLVLLCTAYACMLP